MEELNKERDEVFSKVIKAGKRTYFFDVKETKAAERYITITESKKRFDNAQGKYFFEKHKIFLYKEDFENFIKGLNIAVNFVETGERPEEEPEEAYSTTEQPTKAPSNDEFLGIDFDSVDK